MIIISIQHSRLSAIVLAALLALFLVTGCNRGDTAALVPDAESALDVPAETGGAETALASIQETINPQDMELLRFVSDGYPLMEGEVSNTSWGSSVRVVVGEDYFSAAGGTCRRATIVTDFDKVEIVVKKLDEDRWEIVKGIV